MHRDELRVGCFKRTGVLLTLDGSGDDDIRPQGCPESHLPVKIPDTVDLTADKNYNQPDQVLQPEVWATGLAQEDEEIHEFQSEEDTTGNNLECVMKHWTLMRLQSQWFHQCPF